MVEIKGVYQGEKRCEMVHGPSSSILLTDAPRDNHGKGEAFSPTDLVATALGSCILTTMAIFAEKEGIDLKLAHFKVIKEMQTTPRQISRLPIEIHLPRSVSVERRSYLEDIGRNCPVKRSLGHEVETPMQFFWDV